MKIQRHLRVAVAGAIAFAASAAHADTLAQWTFESSAPTTAGPVAAEVGSGTASGSHASSAVVYSAPAGNGSGHSFSSNNWTAGDYYQFEVSTAGFKDISLSWDQTSSSTGPGNFALEYSTNGTSFSTVNTYSVLGNGTSPNAAWSTTSARNAVYTITDNLASILALNNQTNLFFRLVDLNGTAVNGSAVGTSGTDRVDNFTVSASAVPLPAAAWLLGSGLLGLAGVRRRQFAR